MALTLTLNGTPRRFDDLAPGATVAELVNALGLKSDRVALERNGDIAPRTRWIDLTLAEDDRIELVHFVGGGTDSSTVGSD